MEQDLLVWDVSLYSTSSRDAAKRDGIGLITEQISGEAENGQYIFDTKTRISLQLTPPEHEYIQIRGENRGEFLMVAPESLSTRKDILSQITDWRRSLDRRAMATVRNQFFQAKVDDMFFWFSAKAEEWEEPVVRKNNGDYGYLYAGKVVQEAGVRKLIVHDFKTDLSTTAYYFFLQKVATHLVTNHHPEEAFLDKAMTTVARVHSDSAEKIDDITIWQWLSEAKGVVTGGPNIFNLPIDIIINLQDRRLHQKLEQSAAAEVADWMMAQINSGMPKFRIQAQIRERFIDATKRALGGFERMSYVKDYSNDGRLYKDNLDPQILKPYSGSSGNFCGGWGSGKSGNSRDILKGVTLGSEIIGGISSIKEKCQVCGIREAVAGGCGFCHDCGGKAA